MSAGYPRPSGLNRLDVLNSGPWRDGYSAIYFGDSNMGDATEPPNHSLRMGPWITFSAEGRIRVIRNAGVSGNTTAQMLARIQADVIDHKPAMCIVLGGTNDAAGNVTLATYRANMGAILDRLINARIRPIVLAVTPRAASKTLISQYNAWITAYCGQRGIQVIDTYTPVVDHATSGIAAAYNVDGTHFNEAGYRLLGQTVFNAIDPLLPKAALGPALTNDDPTNLIVNGHFVGDANLDGIADSWTGSGTTGPSLVAGGADVPGNWQQMAATGIGTRYLNQVVTLGTNGAPGDLMHFCGVADIGASADGAQWSIYAQPRTAANAAIFPHAYGFYRIKQEHPTTAGGFTFSHHFVVPPDCTNFRIMIQVETGAATGRFAQITLRNMTALGLV